MGRFNQCFPNFLCSIYIIRLIWYNGIIVCAHKNTEQAFMYTRSSDFEERKLKMKKERQNADQEALFEAILTLRSPEECYAFFKDLCTYQELNAMAQRLQVAKMLHSGHVFHEIVEETGASTATISRVNRAIKDGCDGYQIIFDRTESPEPPKE